MSKKIIRLNETQLTNIIERVIKEMEKQETIEEKTEDSDAKFDEVLKHAKEYLSSKKEKKGVKYESIKNKKKDK